MIPVESNKEFEKLYEIIQQLRGPGGCPWDQEQSPENIKKYLIEETQELADAISQGDSQHICEEIGDLFFILLLIVQMYEDENFFTIHDALTGITKKMIRRHPHVFSGTKTGTPSELKQQWEAIKAQEKNKS